MYYETGSVHILQQYHSNKGKLVELAFTRLQWYVRLGCIGIDIIASIALFSCSIYANIILLIKDLV
jgi:hypothetical protein